MAGQGGVVVGLKGSDFIVNGAITAFDGKTYTVATGRLETVEVDASKCGCLGPCPAARLSPTPGLATGGFAANMAASSAAPTVAPPIGTGTSAAPTMDRRPVISGSEMIGQRSMAELLAAFAASTGARRGVYRTLLALAQGNIEPARITARSFGKLALVACNNSVTHRALNRRVEVWLQN